MPRKPGRSKETTHAQPERQNDHHRRCDRLKLRSGDLPRDARRRHHGRKLHVQHMGRLPDQHAGDCPVEDLVSRACQPHPSVGLHARYPPAKTEGKTGVILGWQNAVGFDDHLPFIEVAYELGLRIVQMTYNTATSVGGGCYESNDGGLTDFGRDVVDEFNRLGILVDLSHVGSKTAADVIAYSKKPVAYTHCLPAAVNGHPRNKSDQEWRNTAGR